MISKEMIRRKHHFYLIMSLNYIYKTIFLKIDYPLLHLYYLELKCQKMPKENCNEFYLNFFSRYMITRGSSLHKFDAARR